MAGIIRTINGDIAPDTLGVCLCHEHIYGQPPEAYAHPDLTITDETGVIAELRDYTEAGGHALIEMTTPDYGRDAAAMRRIAAASGVQIVATTGYNKEKFSRPFLEAATINTLTNRFIHDVLVGMDNTNARAGLLKASSMLNDISPLTEKLFYAIANAHHATRAPISTHTEMGTMALEQVDLLVNMAVDPQHIIIGHMDHHLDLAYHRTLAATGVYIGFDQIGKTQYAPDEARAALIIELIDAGYANQLLIGGDTARRSYWRSGGGRGYQRVIRDFVPLLTARGVSQAIIDQLLIHNPARALTFTPIC